MVWPFAVELPQDVPQREPALGVEAGGRLVEEEHGGPVEDRPGDHQPLGHPAREGVDRCLRPLGQLELLEQLVGRPPRLPGADAEEPAVEVEVLPDVQLAVERVLLGDDADELLGQRRVGDDVDAADERLARGRDRPGW